MIMPKLPAEVSYLMIYTGLWKNTCVGIYWISGFMNNSEMMAVHCDGEYVYCGGKCDCGGRKAMEKGRGVILWRFLKLKKLIQSIE